MEGWRDGGMEGETSGRFSSHYMAKRHRWRQTENGIKSVGQHPIGEPWWAFCHGGRRQLIGRKGIWVETAGSKWIQFTFNADKWRNKEQTFRLKIIQLWEKCLSTSWSVSVGMFVSVSHFELLSLRDSQKMTMWRFHSHLLWNGLDLKKENPSFEFLHETNGSEMLASDHKDKTLVYWNVWG